MTTRMIGTALGLALAAGAATAQDYPSGTVEMIVPFSAGGGTDGVARQFAPPFAEALGANVVIRNVDGASGTIGTATAAQADPDGYTVGYIPIGPLAIQPVLRPLDYDVESFDYICQTTDNPVLVMVSSGSDVQSLADLQERGSVVYGSSGPGTIPHLALAAVTDALGIEGTHVPYDGTGPAMNALAGGEIQVFGDTPGVVRANDVRPLAILAPERHPDYPEVPTAAEEGFENLDFSVWQGLVVPAGTDPAIRDQLSQACQAAMESEAFTSAMETAATGLTYRNAEEFEAFVRRNTETNRNILRDAGLIE
ncbi:Bug family tripartite tricarboxylate transporter substrate binding protein [Jannaschia formosa]|uniref:Bug family tripartite tricarboxylate transporter substrate binding protein n=1 Tax=Jannaschia formosa TaxID=2259592 RepID=UPI000E1C088F|nr:tripartite tricarboxylate transporter substrate binding protein [Jannaschia formosa]TFL16051.1 tripartite tricarboxylate transporter substrate binding protein [Jannaschia formosa]